VELALPGAASAPTLLAPGRHDLRKPPARPEPEPTPAPWQPSEADRREIAGYISGADDATWAAFVAQCERIGADQDDMESWTEAQFAALLGYVRDQKAAAE
jgi:hypothetical protein